MNTPMECRITRPLIWYQNSKIWPKNFDAKRQTEPDTLKQFEKYQSLSTFRSIFIFWVIFFQIKDYYWGKEIDAAQNTLQGFVNAISDSSYAHPVDTAAKIHAMKSMTDVYVYHFGYRGKNSHTTLDINNYPPKVSNIDFLKVLESVHNNLVRKIRPHIGGQVLHPTNLRKLEENLKKLHYVHCLQKSSHTY